MEINQENSVVYIILVYNTSMRNPSFLSTTTVGGFAPNEIAVMMHVMFKRPK